MPVPTPPSLPRLAAWRHCGAREGFEVCVLEPAAGGLRVEGHTVAVEENEPFAVRYQIELDARWVTRSARVWGRSRSGQRAITLEADGLGRWRADGHAVAEVEGCLDVDLESSALTNAFPVHRLALAPGATKDAPAAYVRALDLGIQRIEQRYARVDDGAGPQRYAYESATFAFACELVYDDAGLVLDYPGIATRAEL